MHVAYITHSLSRYGGGVSEAVRRLAGELQEAGQRVDVLGIRDRRADADLSNWQAVVPRPLDARGPAALGYVPRLARELATLGPEVVHTHGLWKHVSAHVVAWSRRTGRPYVVSPHGMLDPWAIRRSRWKKAIAAAWFESRHLRSAHLLHALNEAEHRAIRNYGLRNPVCVIPNGVDLPPAPPPRTGLRRLVFLGRLHPKKGLRELLEAWSRWNGPSDRGMRLAIAGWDDGGYEAQLRGMISELGLGATAALVGPAFGEAKAALLREADAFILPSYSEGLPVAVLEAWSYGLPVLMTDECNLPEGFAADAALRITPDAAGIAAGFDALATMSDAERTAMGTRGRDLVARLYQWPRVAEQFAATYAWLIGGGTAPACARID